ncbi:LysR family transcriptional regulator [Deefgea tanakiae]|uniref:LysR family transcriptional regulator n=1 Tax=Deefgea tanakiae TaxID=2865840 RepID=A0ABX8Z7E0_9NEIS|nr:LysR family transcriptional regulator [Deefgea tanakiae]QZA78501.1 LysR family transcriptional regulator [Deefgea tanakiae]
MNPIEPLNQQLLAAITFAAVIEYGSFTAAAEKLGYTKGLASRRVAQLEKQLGVQLLFRTTRKLSLTEAGRVYLAHCQQWPQWIAQAEQAVHEASGQISGKIRITVPTSFGGTFMAEALIAFRRRYPAVQVELDLSREMRDLETDGFDLAIRSKPAAHERVIAIPIMNADDWLVASPALFTEKAAPQQLSELKEWPCIANSHFKNPLEWIFNDGADIVSIQSPLQINDHQLIRNLALAGAGIARLPSYLVAADIMQQRLVRLIENARANQNAFYLVYPPRTPQPAKVRAMIDFLKEWFVLPNEHVLKCKY